MVKRGTLCVREIFIYKHEKFCYHVINTGSHQSGYPNCHKKLCRCAEFFVVYIRPNGYGPG